jgi:hypothetical protein
MRILLPIGKLTSGSSMLIILTLFIGLASGSLLVSQWVRKDSPMTMQVLRLEVLILQLTGHGAHKLSILSMQACILHKNLCSNHFVTYVRIVYE